MKTNILYIATLLAAFALPANGQTDGSDTKTVPSYPSMPYKLSTIVVGTNHGTMTVKDNNDEGGVIVIDNDTLVYGSSGDFSTTYVALIARPDTGYVVRDTYPKAYKTGDTSQIIKVKTSDDSTYTFRMRSCPVTVEMAYAALLKSIQLDTLTLTKMVSTAAEVVPLLPAKLPLSLVSGKSDSLAVTAGSWTLQEGATFNAASGAINRFTCTLAALPDSIFANGVALTGMIDVANKSLLAITTAKDLADLRDDVNKGHSYEGLTITLKNDIALSDDWTTSIGDESNPFCGTFNGQGFRITGLKVSTTSENAGLFGYIGTGGTVKNLALSGSVTGTLYVGAIAGNSEGTITNCFSDVIVKTTSTVGNALVYVGGIVGYLTDGMVSNCRYDGPVISVETSGNTKLGGIAGSAKGKATISYCYATGKVDNQSTNRLNNSTGGIVGQIEDNASGSITRITGCIAFNTITNEKAGSKGRIVGYSNSTITIADCYAAATIPGSWTSDTETSKKNGADLSRENFFDSNDACASWPADNWEFDTERKYLPFVKTTGLTPNIRVGNQPDSIREVYKDYVDIDTLVTYEASKHKGKRIFITSKGILKATQGEAPEVKNLDIEEGGQVQSTLDFTITNKLETKRILSNKWTTFGSPFGDLYSLKSIYTLTGYKEVNNQTWGDLSDYRQAVFKSNIPHLIATEEADTVTFKCVPAGTLKPATPETGADTHTGIFLFKTNPSLCNHTLKNVYTLSDEGTRFELQDSIELKPFQSYLVANDVTTATVKSLFISGTPTSNQQPALLNGSFRIWGSNGVLHLAADEPGNVTIYDFSGRLVRQFTLTGEQTINLGRGLYLIHNNNITYKISL